MTETVPVEFKENDNKTKKLIIPFIFGIGVFLLDQLSKSLVVKFIPLYTIKFSFFGDFLRIIHVRNLGAAFSMGVSLPGKIRSLLLAFIPVIILILFVIIYFRNNTLTQLQRWLYCGVIGGGFGNVVDRLFRKQGVVDFIDVKFYGLFGFERWPTFNVADSAVVVCGIILIISFIISIKADKTSE